MNMPIKEVAKELKKSQQFVRIGLQRGILPFGTAQIVSGNKYSYYISPEKFYKYIGKPIPNKYIKIEKGENYGIITDTSLAKNISWRWNTNAISK